MKNFIMLIMLVLVLSSCLNDGSNRTMTGTIFSYYEVEGVMLDIDSEVESNFKPAANTYVSMFHRSVPKLVPNCCYPGAEPTLRQTSSFLASSETDANGMYSISAKLFEWQEEGHTYISTLGSLADFEEKFNTQGDVYTYQSRLVVVEIWDDINNLDNGVALYITNRNPLAYEKRAFSKGEISFEDGKYPKERLEPFQENGLIVYRTTTYLIQNTNYEFEYVLNGTDRVSGQFYSGNEKDIRKLIIRI